MRLMRSTVSGFAGTAAVALFAVLLPLFWVTTHITSEDGYVDFTSEMIQDEQFRDRLTQTTTDVVTRRTGAPRAASDVVSAALSAAADRLASQPAFAEAWARTQRQSHRALFDEGELVIDVAPLAQVIVDAASGRLPVSVEVPDQLLVPVGAAERSAVIDGLDAAPQVATVVGLLLLAASAVAVVSARRSGAALSWLGIGFVGAALLDRLAAHEVVPRVLSGDPEQGSLARRTQDLLIEQAVSSFDGTTLIAMGLGAVLVVAGLVVRR